MNSLDLDVPVCLHAGDTKVNFRKLRYLWTIHNYKRVHDKRAALVNSPHFPIDDEEFKWYLCFDPSSTEEIYLSLKTGQPTDSEITKYYPIIGTLKVSIINAENQETETQTREFTIDHIYKSAGLYLLKKTRLLETETLQLLPQDRLTIACEVSYVTQMDIVNYAGPSFPTFSEECKSYGLEDFERLFMDEEFSDVTLCIDDKKFPAHKTMLIARSSVFKNMFRNEMKEKKSNIIEIEGIKESIFIEMLRYIYTGKPQNIDTLAPELLEVADRYDLSKLKLMCEKELFKNLSTETAIDVLILSDRHNAVNLKTQTIQFIKVNSCNSNILTEEIREELVTSNPRLLLEILDTFGMSLQ